MLCKSNTSRITCAISDKISETVCHTSYSLLCAKGDLLDSDKTWETCQATSTASFPLDPMAVRGHGAGLWAAERGW
jgi:hypothetical protein